MIKEDHFVFFIMFFVEKYCKSIYENFEYKGRGRPPLSPKNMLILVLYCYMIKIFSPSQISRFSKTNSVFKLILEGILVSITSVSCYKTYF